MRIERWAVLWLFVWMGAAAAFAQGEQAESIVYRDAIVVKETLESIMARPEFRRLTEKPEPEPSSEKASWLERLFEWLEEVLASEPEAGAPNQRSFAGVNYLVYALAGAGFIVVLAFILKTVLSTRRQKSLPREDARALIVQSGKTPGGDVSRAILGARRNTPSSKRLQRCYPGASARRHECYRKTGPHPVPPRPDQP